MNRQGLFQLALLTLFALVAIFGSNATLFAQAGKANTRSTKPTRPSSDTLRLQEQRLSPDLERILKDWSDSSSRIEKLQGKHTRWVYDHTFAVIKMATGDFYYESPDKGRIDIAAHRNIPNPHQKVKPPGPNGKPAQKVVLYKVESDKPERWIADGVQIRKIDDALRSVEVFTIPPQARGRQIMDGPLPFLFGMPPEKAKKRFRFRLVRETKETVQLQIWPKLYQDRANWKEAQVILWKPSYLPRAVKLIDPAGTADTAYEFGELKVNKARTIFQKVLGRDWTNPKLTGYQVNVNEPQKQQIPQRPPAGKIKTKKEPVIPSLIGLHYKEAEKILKQIGCSSSLHRGTQTSNEKLLYRVQAQLPKPGAPYKKGQKVALKVYDKPTATSQK